MHIFAYGSLMDPSSLRSTLPEVDLGACVPARAKGYVRCFDVAFPNDGSQSDKRYYDASARPPAHVLMCNLRPEPAYAVNGVCIPVDDDALARLMGRERRYDLADLTGAVERYPRELAAPGALPGTVLTFLGRPEFTGVRTPSAGHADAYVSRAYLDSITAGAKYWEAAAPEFHHLTMACTLFPPPERITDLVRVDL